MRPLDRVPIGQRNLANGCSTPLVGYRAGRRSTVSVDIPDAAQRYAARLMRRVLVDHARSRAYQKRRGAAEHVTLDDALVVSPSPDLNVLALDRALEKLGAFDARKCRVIELRFFGGLSVEETAEVLQVSTDTVKRDWRLARLWLLRELEGEAQS